MLVLVCAGSRSVPEGDCMPVGDDGGGVGVSPIDQLKMELADRLHFEMNTPGYLWVFGALKPTLIRVNGYLDDQGYSLEAMEFMDAVIAAGKDSEVDYDKEIITNFSTKSQCVYNKLIETALQNHNLIRDTFLYFGNNTFSGANLIYQEEANLTNTNGVLLLGSFNRVGNNYYVTINNSQLNNRSPIEIAQTIIHESVHALLKLHYVTSEESFVALFRQYMLETSGANSITHNIMRNNYVLPIANTLSQFDNGIEESSFYESLAWEGLQEFMTTEEINANLQAKTAARNRGLNCN